MNPNDGAKYLKREILIRLIKAFYSNNFSEEVRTVPYQMRPKGCEVNFRCCVHKERAILRDRIIADLGFAIEDAEEQVLLSTYADQALSCTAPTKQHPLTILETACKGCVPSRIYVTDLCQGCVARPCVNTCKFGAINIVNGRALIDAAKCRNCGMCLNVCPYKAIAKLIVPCENACPVGAIAKNVSGHAQINAEKCITCGKCINACPFGAVHEKRQLFAVLHQIKKGQRVVAMVAPAIMGQLPGSAEQLHAALKQIGFYKVYEVAQGADITAAHEAVDFKERLAKGEPFMTTSCCAGYNELVDKHLPELKPYRSAAQTPLSYTAEIAKAEHPGAITVFLSPCVAKRTEALKNPYVDYILTFEELGALLIALKIEVNNCEPEPYQHKSSKQGRMFALTQGVAKAVASIYSDEKNPLRPVVVNGITKESIKDLRRYAKNAVCELGNLVEVMCCEGGCIGGNATINTSRMSCKQLTEYANTGEDLKEE